MKKIIIIGILFVFISFLYLLKSDVETTFIEKIDLNISEDEIGITFLNYKESNYLLLSTINSKSLIILKESENDEILDTLSMFSALDLNNVFGINKSDIFQNSKIQK